MPCWYVRIELTPVWCDYITMCQLACFSAASTRHGPWDASLRALRPFKQVKKQSTSDEVSSPEVTWVQAPVELPDLLALPPPTASITDWIVQSHPRSAQDRNDCLLFPDKTRAALLC